MKTKDLYLLICWDAYEDETFKQDKFEAYVLEQVNEKLESENMQPINDVTKDDLIKLKRKREQEEKARKQEEYEYAISRLSFIRFL